jgi:hypothetical protein
VVVAVHAQSSDGDEEVARPGLARVVDDPGDLVAAAALQVAAGDAGRQLSELHGETSSG